MEAIKFLQDKKAEFAANQFDRKEAIKFVKFLYKLGASKIEILNNPQYEDIDDDEIYADSMLITLPKSLSKRLDIVLAIWAQTPSEVSDGERIQSCYDMNWRSGKKVLLWWD